MTTKTLTDAEIRNIDANLAMLDEVVYISLGSRWTFDKHVAHKRVLLQTFDTRMPLTDEQRKLMLELLTCSARAERNARSIRAAAAKARKARAEAN